MTMDQDDDPIAREAVDESPVTASEAIAPAKACPACRHEIEPDARRDDAGLAACWECRRLWNLGELVDASGELSSSYVADITNPPEGAYFTDDGLTQVVGGKIRSPVAKFLLIFGCVWGGLFLSGMYGSQIVDMKFDLGLTLMGLIPAAVTAGLLYFGLLLKFGRSEAVVRGSECLLFTGFGPWGWSKRLDTARVRGVRVGNSGMTANNRPLKAIIIDADDEVKFAALLSDTRRDFVYAVLRKLLQA
ncbi:MAG: hypothetical protein HBSAPP03_28000 [Phycisphaerae bacterium]|nr:MAG: hypothetical protein HBSAPP03_28000 [Phycisphaerae bacterium]